VFVRFITNVALFVLLGTQVIPVHAIMLLSLGIVFSTFLVLFSYDHYKAGKRVSAV
jgi:hypothetical protein